MPLFVTEESPQAVFSDGYNTGYDDCLNDFIKQINISAQMTDINTMEGMLRFFNNLLLFVFYNLQETIEEVEE